MRLSSTRFAPLRQKGGPMDQQKQYPNEDIPNQKIQKSGDAGFVFFAR